MKLTDKMYALYFPSLNGWYNKHAFRLAQAAMSPSLFESREEALGVVSGARVYFARVLTTIPTSDTQSDSYFEKGAAAYETVQLVEYSVIETKREVV